MRDVSTASIEDVTSRTRLLENEIRIMRLEVTRITHEIHNQKEKIKENTEKIKVNKNLPYLVSNVIEVSFIWELFLKPSSLQSHLTFLNIHVMRMSAFWGFHSGNLIIGEACWLQKIIIRRFDSQ